MARATDESTIWTRQFFTFVALGLVAAALLVGFFLWWNRKGHLELRGGIQKTRIQATDDNSSMAVLDFRVTNPSEVPFVVQEVKVILIDADGKEVEGTVAAEVDAERVMNYYPALSPKYNKSMTTRDKVNPEQTIDRMVMAGFPVSEAQLNARKNLLVRIFDVDGAVSELAERRP